MLPVPKATCSVSAKKLSGLRFSTMRPTGRTGTSSSGTSLVASSTSKEKRSASSSVNTCRPSSHSGYASKIFLTTGDVLYSNDSRRMFTILEDRVGRHDFLLTPCSQEMFEILYRHQGHHPSCFENLHTAFAEFGITPDQIGTTFNVFMNVGVDAEGKVSVNVPKSGPGDYVELRADMDMICALTSCSAEKSNNGSFKPIDYEIITRPC
jgi:uncharacterized protein YcgI (DUF1989 family)